MVISGVKPSRELVKVQVTRSSEALQRVSQALVKPGISLRPKKDVPRYSVAEGESGVLVRQLNGKTERGRLVDGTFQVID